MEDKATYTAERTFTTNKLPISIKKVHNQTSITASSLFSSKENIATKFRSGSSSKNTVGTLAFRLSRSVTSLGEDLNDIPVNKVKAAPKSNAAKNEAEIIDDLPINQIRATFPVVTGIDRLVAAAISCSVGKSRGQGQRRGSTSESMDSDLRNLRRNSLEGRRFQKAVSDLDRQSSAGVNELGQKIKEVFKDYNKMLQRSPTADEWLLLKKSRNSMLEEREREDIARRFSRRERQFRAPPCLLETVSKIRSHAMMEAGLVLDAETDGSAETDIATTMESLNLSRRHTISSGILDDSLPQVNNKIQQTPRNSPRYGRRMTLADTRILQDVLELKGDHMLKYYLSSFLKEKSNLNDMQEHPLADSAPSTINEEITVTEMK